MLARIQRFTKRQIGRIFPKLAIRWFWDDKAAVIHEQWGNSRHDFELVASCIQCVAAKTILDVGCGSGRLFPLYNDLGISFVGCDIAPTCITLCKPRFPTAELRVMPIIQVSTATLGQTFDLAICNRILQHISPADVDAAVRAIGSVAKAVYANEMTIEQAPKDSAYLFGHDYSALFSLIGFAEHQSGWLEVPDGPPQRWFVFKAIKA